MTSTGHESNGVSRSAIRGFWALNWTQFQGAFNDNLYRFVIAFFLIERYAASGTAGDEADTMKITAITAILFSVPFLLFPALAGSLADRYSKRSIAIMTKFWEVGVMTVGLFAFQIGHPGFILFMLFLMFTQSTFFSPAKYGILPEMLPESRLSWANGLLGMATFVAIIAGQSASGLLSEKVRQEAMSMTTVSLILIVLSCLGACASFAIPRTAPAAPGRPIAFIPWSGLGKHFAVYRKSQVLWLSLLGIAFFWMAGAIVQLNVVTHGLAALQVGEFRSTLLLVALLLGIAAGSAGAGYVSRRRIELGLIPIGMGGMALASLLIAIPGLTYQTTSLLLVGLGFFAGFFQVPLMAVIQHRTPANSRGGLIATMNICTSVGVLAGGGLYYAAAMAGLGTRHVFLFVALLTVAILTYLCIALPYFVVRSAMWLMINTLYRVRVLGIQNLPQEGGALLVSNHISYLDALFLGASTDRQIRFIMSAEFQKRNAWLKPFARVSGAIAISPTGGPRDLIRAIQEARDAIREGWLVCIFAEGQITRSGQMLPFKKGFEKIVKGLDAPIIPVHLDRLWGSLFSYSEGRVLWKWPRQVPYPVTVSYGSPLPSDTTVYQLRARIREIATEAYMHRETAKRLLHHAFVSSVRRFPRRKAIADATIPHMSYVKTLIASLMFARKLKRVAGDAPMVGVLLPPTVGAALTNIALLFMGKIPINLNYTASREYIESAVKQCGITHVLTARKFLEKFPVEFPGEAVYLEDVRSRIKPVDKIAAMLMAATTLLISVRLVERMLGCKARRKPDDLATIIFSSGSEGEPKGVMLTHFNIMSNVEACLQVFPVNDDGTDSIVGILPLFHSFGYMATLWLALTGGWNTVFHPSPLDAKAIGALVKEHRCTILITAPTFLQNFIRRCLPDEFASLQFVVTGAEKLPARVREAFKARFGIEPLEGYGTTECSPVVAVNIPDFTAPGFFQIGTKHGTIGQPIPGISVRIADPDTGEPLPEGERGMLQVKGPNIMKGYLNNPKKTNEVLHDGWYTTGDIASIDEDGFITIHDRLARFSKIAGEMVPHTRVEEELHLLLGLTDLAMAVSSLPDATKGERLVVLHTLEEEQLEELVRKLDTSSLPRLWIPRAASFYRVEQIPILGTGKLNLRAVKEMAASLDLGGD